MPNLGPCWVVLTLRGPQTDPIDTASSRRSIAAWDYANTANQEADHIDKVKPQYFGVNVENLAAMLYINASAYKTIGNRTRDGKKGWKHEFLQDLV